VRQLTTGQINHERARILGKLRRCIHLARECEYLAREEPENRRKYKTIRREAVEDARYWRRQLHKLERYAEG